MGNSTSTPLSCVSNFTPYDAHYADAKKIDQMIEKHRCNLDWSKNGLRNLDKVINDLWEAIVARLRHLYKIRNELNIDAVVYEVPRNDIALLGNYTTCVQIALKHYGALSEYHVNACLKKAHEMFHSLMNQVHQTEQTIIQHHIRRVSIPPAPPAPVVAAALETTADLVKRRRATRLHAERAARAQRAAELANAARPRPKGLVGMISYSATKDPVISKAGAARAARANRMRRAAEELISQQNELRG